MVSPPTLIEQVPLSNTLIDLATGQPEPALLPWREVADAMAAAIARTKHRSLAYGREAGPSPLIDWLGSHLARIDSRAPARSGMMITAGNSHALDHLATIFARAGEVALVEVPTYHYALDILRDHGLDIVGVSTDVDGLVPEALEEVATRVAASGRRVGLLYSIPTFANPSGLTLAVERRARVAEVAAAHSFVVIEDDVYRELWYEVPPPPSVEATAAGGSVLRLGSFAKSLAPSLRLGWLTGAASNVERILGSGLLGSGGGLNPLPALAVAELAASGFYERNVERLRITYRRRRDVLLTALRAVIPGASFDVPRGGYFLWLRLPDRLDAASLLPAARAAGVTFVPGARFDASGALEVSWLRLSFTMYGDDDLALGAQRLGAVVSAALAAP